MNKPDYYKILGINKDATPDEVRKAFRTLAAKYHPDRNKDDPTAEAKFKQINEANSILSDPDKRAEYDNPSRGFSGFSGGDPFAGMGDIFSTIFGGGRQQRRPNGPQRGQDIQTVQVISLTDSVQGKKIQVDYKVPINCGICKGNGCKPNTSPQQCKGCNGLGQVMFRQGTFQITQPCGQCGGRGQVITDPCTRCNGGGTEETPKSISVTIPPGVDDGARLRISGAGVPSRDGGETGDLYLVISVATEQAWQRRGRDLVNIAPIPIATAALGGKIKVKHPNGNEVDVEVPKGTQPGDTAVIHGKGIKPHGEQRFGDLHVIFNLAIPKTLTPEAEKLFSQLQSELDKTGT